MRGELMHLRFPFSKSSCRIISNMGTGSTCGASSMRAVSLVRWSSSSRLRSSTSPVSRYAVQRVSKAKRRFV